MLERGSPWHAWRWFAAWSVPGALFAFALVAAASFGVLFLPVAAVAFWLLFRRAPDRKGLWGLVLGAGIASAALGIINLDYYAGTCPERDNVERLPTGGTKIEGCGGFDPVPFFIAAAVLVAVAVAGHARSAGRRSGGASEGFPQGPRQ